MDNNSGDSGTTLPHVNERHGIGGALETAFEVVDAPRELNGAGVRELADYLETPVSTVHSHLYTLERLGYVTHNDDEYRLGLKLLDLGSFARKQMKLYQTSKSEIMELTERTSEWANLLVEEHGRRIYLQVEKDDRAVALDVYAGKQAYLHTRALGKAILAHKPEDDVREILDEHGMPEQSP